MKLDLIKAMPILDGLVDEELNVLANNFVASQQPKGSYLFKAGDQSDALYIIDRGYVALAIEAGQKLATLGPGSMLGDDTLFRGATQGVNAIAASEISLLKLPDHKLRETFVRYPEIGIKLSRNYGSLLVQMDDYLVERLAKIDEFRSLPRHTLLAVARQLQPRIVRSQTAIHRGGEMPGALFIVEHGAFELRPDPPMPGQEVQRLSAGSIIGAMALLTNKPYNETALATEDSLLWVLPKESFQSINSSHPGLRRSLGRNVRSRLGKADQAQAVLRLSQMPIFAEVPPQSLQAITQRMVLQHIPAGERVYRIGEAGDAIYLVENGEIELTEENASGVVEEKARVGAGGFLGEMSLLTGLIRTEDATATRNTNLWILYKADLDELTVQHPAIGKALSQGLATRLAEPEQEQHDLDGFREFSILANLSPADLRQVVKYLRPMRYRAGEQIYQANTPADALYFLEHGQVYVQALDGNSWVLDQGEMFGERSILSGEPHVSTVIAETDVDVWMLEKGDFDQLVTRYPNLALSITRMFSRRLTQFPVVTAPPSGSAPNYAPLAPPTALAPRVQMAQRRGGPPQAAPAPASGGFLDWFANLSTFGKVRLALFVLLLLWLLGVAVPWMILNLLSGPGVASGASLQTSSRALVAVATMGSYELMAQDRALAKAVVLADSLAAPTATPLPSPTVTPAGGQQAIFVRNVTAANAATATPAPLLQLFVGAAPAAQAQAADSAPAAAAPAEAQVQAAAVQAARAWDPRLDQLGVTLQEANVPPGQQYWRLVDAHWADEGESAGKHHIYVEVLDENGSRIVGQPVSVTWGEGNETGTTENKNPPDYAFNFQMYAAGYAYNVKVDGLPSDQLSGAGLGSIQQRTYGIHTSYYLTFQKATK
ncbi:MAG: cyclic nucleotide-binding domain-containing protein [Caldilineaceae bacterium]